MFSKSIESVIKTATSGIYGPQTQWDCFVVAESYVREKYNLTEESIAYVAIEVSKAFARLLYTEMNKFIDDFIADNAAMLVTT